MNYSLLNSQDLENPICQILMIWQVHQSAFGGRYTKDERFAVLHEDALILLDVKAPLDQFFLFVLASAIALCLYHNVVLYVSSLISR